MVRNILTSIFISCLLVSLTEAATLHRLPLAYIPYSITAWKDATPKGDGVTKRYDGIVISNPRYVYDGHRGTDFAALSGAAVYASARGTVIAAHSNCPPNGSLGDSCGGGFGNHVAIKHADNIVSIYAHLRSVSVAVGSTISCKSGPGGTLIGYSGNSGASTGAHLHFELRYNDLLKASKSYDPFGGSSSTQTWDYWYDWAWVADPLRPGFNMHYPVTTCQP